MNCWISLFQTANITILIFKFNNFGADFFISFGRQLNSTLLTIHTLKHYQSEILISNKSLPSFCKIQVFISPLINALSIKFGRHVYLTLWLTHLVKKYFAIEFAIWPGVSDNAHERRLHLKYSGQYLWIWYYIIISCLIFSMFK